MDLEAHLWTRDVKNLVHLKVSAVIQLILHQKHLDRAEAVVWGCSVEKVFLEISQNLQENTCARVYLLIKLQALAWNFIKKETLTQVISCEFCKVSKSTFFTEHLKFYF